MQGLESAESTQKRGPSFNFSSLPTSNSFSTPTPSMELFSSLGGEGREGGGEDHQQPAVGITVPGNEDSMYRELEGRFLLCQLNKEVSDESHMSQAVSSATAVQLVSLHTWDRAPSNRG